MTSPTRLYLTDRQWRELFEAQGGKCALPGCESEGPFHADHTIPRAIGGGLPDQLLCHRCHAAKTRKDRRDIAKVKRLAGDTTTQAERRKQRKAEGRPPLLRSRGFQSRKGRTAEEIMGKER